MVKSPVLPTLTSKITSSIGGSWWVPLKNWFPSHPAEAWYTAPLLSISGRSFRSGSSTSQAAAASDDVSGATKTWGRRGVGTGTTGTGAMAVGSCFVQRSPSAMYLDPWTQPNAHQNWLKYQKIWGQMHEHTNWYGYLEGLEMQITSVN